MKNKFLWRLQPDNEYFKELWDDAVFVFDTNVLLDLYRVTRTTYEEIQAVLNMIEDRVWIPYQVADEYFSRREKVLTKEKATFNKANEALEDWKKERKEFQALKGQFGNIGKLISSEIESLLNDQDDFFSSVDNVADNISSRIKEIEKLHVPDSEDNDEILEYLLELFDDRIGDKFTEKELEEIKKEGVERFKKDIPPGFLDFDKDENNFGDLVLWREILSYSQNEQKPIVFITQERKSDWWKKKDHKIHSPHPLLRKEFQEVTGKRFWMYGLNSFLEYSKKYLESNVSDDAITESEELESYQDENLEELTTDLTPEEELESLRNASELSLSTRRMLESLRNTTNLKPSTRRMLESLAYTDELNASIKAFESLGHTTGLDPSTKRMLDSLRRTTEFDPFTKRAYESLGHTTELDPSTKKILESLDFLSHRNSYNSDEEE